MKDLNIFFKTEPVGDAGGGKGSYFYKDNLFIVVDGAGGEYCGKSEREFACQVISQSFFNELQKASSPGNALAFALKKANEELLKGKKISGPNLAISVSVVYIREKLLYFTHLGDSRIYCLRGREINQLTRDHTLLEEEPFIQVKSRDMNRLNILTNGLGIHQKSEIKVKTFIIHEKDLIFITIDGLTRHISNREILHISSKTNSLEKLFNRLIEIADRKGRRNRITVGLIKIKSFPELQQKRLITYSSLAFVILVIIGGLALVYDKGGFEEHKIKDVQPALERSKQRGEKKSNGKVSGTPLIKKKDISTVNNGLQKMENKQFDAEIYSFVVSWTTAWENTAGEKGYIDRYMSFYSDGFSSKNFDKNGWRRDKTRKNRKKRWIRLELKSIKIIKTDSEDRIKVQFLQRYRSSNYSQKSNKILVLNREKSDWKIIAETIY